MGIKVLFLYPNHKGNYMLPPAIGILSACLKRAGHEVDLFDTAFIKTSESIKDKLNQYTSSKSSKTDRRHGGTGLSDKGGLSVFKTTDYNIEDLVMDDPILKYEEVLQGQIDDFKPDVIALSCMTSNFDFACDIMKKVKHKSFVIVGGVHATIAYEDCLNQDFIDMACIGEGDNVLLELLNLMEKNQDYSKVPGMVYKTKNGKIIKNPVAPRVVLDDLPCPDWGLFDKKHLFRPFDGEIYSGSFYSQSRGCPMQCTYCVDPTEAQETGGAAGYFRTQKPETTISHLTELKEKFGATWYKFSDDTFLLPKVDHLLKLKDGFKELGIQFGCSIMTNTVTEEKVEVAKELGCVAMSVGIESGNEEIRRTLNRRYKEDWLVKSFEWMHNAGIRISTFNIIGCPGETRENVFETIDLNRKLNVEACNVYIMFPYPGTPIQIQEGIPIRDDNGKLREVADAKYLGLSEMGPDELDGLEKTFNIYLNLPNSLWPIIEFAEKQENWKDILYYIKEFSIEYIMNDYEYTDISYLNKDEEKILFNNVLVPSKLFSIYLDCNKKIVRTVLSSINKFMLEDERCLKKNDSLILV